MASIYCTDRCELMCIRYSLNQDPWGERPEEMVKYKIDVSIVLFLYLMSSLTRVWCETCGVPKTSIVFTELTWSLTRSVLWRHDAWTPRKIASLKSGHRWTWIATLGSNFSTWHNTTHFLTHSWSSTPGSTFEARRFWLHAMLLHLLPQLLVLCWVVGMLFQTSA